MARTRPSHALLALAALLLVAALVAASRSPGEPFVRAFVDGASRCPVFPPDNHWNRRVDALPVAPDSGRIVRRMHADQRLFADFTIPFATVSAGQRRVRVSFLYGEESDRGRYPIPPDVPVEGGRGSSGDRHVIVLDRDRCRLYELWSAYPRADGARWRAGSGAVWRLRSNRLRPRGWTSADAAGLPILPGLVRQEEVQRGFIAHAIRVTADETRSKFVYPARHESSDDDDPSLPPMGLRMRLRGSLDISGFPRQARVILAALKRYGMIVADQGESWFISGAPSPRWRDAALERLGRVRGSDFEVVDTSSLPRPGR
jgi:hypothetical protein